MRYHYAPMTRASLSGAITTAFLMLVAGAVQAQTLDVNAWLRMPGVRLVAVTFVPTECDDCKASGRRYKTLGQRYFDLGLRVLTIVPRNAKGECGTPADWPLELVYCDYDGTIAQHMKVFEPLQAFLYDWRGGRLLHHASVDEVEQAVDRWMMTAPKIRLDVGRVPRDAGLGARDLRTVLLGALRESGKFRVTGVAARHVGRAVEKRCPLSAQDRVPDAVIEANLVKKRDHLALMLKLRSTRDNCLIASSSADGNLSTRPRSVGSPFVNCSAPCSGVQTSQRRCWQAQVNRPPNSPSLAAGKPMGYLEDDRALIQYASGRTAYIDSKLCPGVPVAQSPPQRGAKVNAGHFGERAQSLCHPDRLPPFPYPVPPPSTSMRLSGDLVSRLLPPKTTQPTLRHVADALSNKAKKVGYTEQVYYGFGPMCASGFALVTRLERITEDGAPYPDQRRFVQPGEEGSLSFLEELESLFLAHVGFYRLIVFVITDQPKYQMAPPQMTSTAAADILASGAQSLTGLVADVAYTEDIAVDALVYELRHAADETGKIAHLIPKSRLAPHVHLIKAGIFSESELLGAN